MISRPTTEQILNNCSRELVEVVLPAGELQYSIHRLNSWAGRLRRFAAK